MRTCLFLLAILVFAGAYGCSEAPMQASADDARPSTDVVVNTDTVGRGGNVMGGGH